MLINRLPLCGSRSVIFALVVAVSLLIASCGSSDATSQVSSVVPTVATSALPTTTTTSTTVAPTTTLSPAQLLSVKVNWNKFFNNLKPCGPDFTRNCVRSAGTGIIGGEPIAATLSCDWVEYLKDQWACDWTIDFYKYVDQSWSLVSSVLSQLHDEPHTAFFAEMTGDGDTELFFNVLLANHTQSEVHRFVDEWWVPATFDGESVITGGYFDAKSGQMESSFQDWPCDFRSWKSLVYTWDQTEFKATSGKDENGKPISLKEALKCNE
ncbi:MAG: hypothetical protein NT119_01010 [Actinobacteria bacterium]|nr:hypothetical protein [Actinomycetota bacterium]